MPHSLVVGNLGVGQSLCKRQGPGDTAEGAIDTRTSSQEDVQRLATVNERMAFLLALWAELARTDSAQEVVCTAMARLRERLGASRAALAEIDEEREEAVLLRESDGAAPRTEIASVPLEAVANLAAQLGDGAILAIADTSADRSGRCKPSPQCSDLC